MLRKPLQNKVVMFVLALVFIAIFPLIVSAYPNQVDDSQSRITTNINVAKSSDKGLNFSIDTPDFRLIDEEIQVTGLDLKVTTPGEPLLPYYSTFIAVPPGATTKVQIDPGIVVDTAVSRIQPVPKYGMEEIPVDPQALSALGFDVGSVTLETSLQPNAAIYTADSLYPQTIYTLSEPMVARDVRLVELRVYPVRYNPVSETIAQAHNIQVSVAFEGAQLKGLRPLPSQDDAQFKQLQDSVINYEQAQSFRSLPSNNSASTGIRVPSDADSYKIEVNADGIYEISGSELAAQGMNIGSVNSANIEMMSNGEAVAYQFIDNNSNNTFDANDAVRFYGKAFDGSRYEKHFITNNIYWLWAEGNASEISNVNNSASTGLPVVTTFKSSITKEPEITNFSTWTNKWDDFPNDADNFYWALITQNTTVSSDPVIETFEIDLPDPVPGTTDNSYLLEVMAKDYPLSNSQTNYTIRGYINDYADFSEESWTGQKNLNLTNTVPGNELLQSGDPNYPTNSVDLYLNTANAVIGEVYLNRITVDYLRNLVSINDELIFSSTSAGNNEFQVAGFSEGDANQLLVWDISNDSQPVAISVQAGDISGAGPYTLKIGRQHAANANIIATAVANINSVLSIKSYTPTSIEPTSGKAAWLAITHANFTPAANQLANYRSADMSTFVVDIKDIVNQSGYGFNSPTAIKTYLANALNTWQTAPSYVTIFGDATTNPRQLPCLTPCGSWNDTEETFVVTDLQYTDPFQGVLPTDFSLSLLNGNDLLPDVAIGRLPAKTLAEANAMVDKIILYETQREDNPQNWQNNILFAADDTDTGGNFCAANEAAGLLLPASYNQVHLCMPEKSEAATDAMRQDMYHWINDVGVSILNWRGHGSIQDWANPALLSVDSSDFWLNNNKSVVILSADCLDGYFARPDLPGLGETFFKYEDRGSAAHWSAAGLGYNFQHTILVNGFYTALYDLGQTTIGDAINYSKTNYIQSGQDKSEAFGFILLGDPAMKLVPESNNVYIPIIFNKG